MEKIENKLIGLKRLIKKALTKKDQGPGKAKGPSKDKERKQGVNALT